MKIKSLRIKNYKSFFDSGEIIFGEGFNLIVGKNNSGKTAFIECLRSTIENKPHTSTLNIRDENDQRRLDSEREISIEYTGKDITTYLRSIPIGSNFAILSANENARLQPLEALTLYSSSNIEVKYTTTSSQGNRIINKSNHPYAPAQDVGAFASNNSMMHIFRIDGNADYEFVGDASNPFSGELSSQLSNFASTRIYYFNAERYKIGSSSYSSENILQPDAGNLPRVLSYITGKDHKNYEIIIKYIKEIFPSIVDLRVINGKNGFEIVTWLEDLGSSRPDLAVPLDNSGSGVGQILAMLYVIVTSTLPQVIIIDEPNNFLHPGASRHLIEILKVYPQHQYFLTTHSPEIIKSLDVATVHVVTWERPQSKVETIDAKNTQNILRIFAEVGARFSDVYGADSVLWVEGETEEACFKLICDSLVELKQVPLISPVTAVGDFDSEKRVKMIASIYRRLSTSSGLLPTPVGFIFDRELRAEGDLAELKRISDGKIHFIKRRQYENYLLDLNAIIAVINSLETFSGNPIAETKVLDWISENGNNRKYTKETFSEPFLEDKDWLSKVDASKLLAALFEELSEAKETYRKTVHSVALNKWIMNNNSGALGEIVQTIKEAIG